MTAPPPPASAHAGGGEAPAACDGVRGAGDAAQARAVVHAAAAPCDGVRGARDATQERAVVRATAAAPDIVVMTARSNSQKAPLPCSPARAASDESDHDHPIHSPVQGPSNAPPEQFYTPGTPNHHHTSHRARLNKFISRTPEALPHGQHSSPTVASPVAAPAATPPPPAPAPSAGLLPPAQPAAPSPPSVPPQPAVATGAADSEPGGGPWLHRALRRLAGVNAPGLSESATPLGRTRSQKPPSNQ